MIIKIFIISITFFSLAFSQRTQRDFERELKAQNPGVPVMIYINSYAEAKAECDVCCTSANAEKIAMEMPGDELIFVPDLFFAQNLENVLDNCSINKDTFFKDIQDQKIKDELKQLTESAFKKDIFGAPTFVVNDQIFWGQDRSDYALDEYDF